MTLSRPPSTASALRRSSAHGSVFGVQFHPEKSSAHGLRMLESFVDVCADSAVAARTAAARA